MNRYAWFKRFRLCYWWQRYADWWLEHHSDDLQSIISTLSAHAQRPVDFAVETTADKLLKIEDVLALAK